jgi:Xaa-Pro aminopeptidase
MKAAKNPTEVAGMLAAHQRDAMALCDWAARLAEAMTIGGGGDDGNWTEVSAAQLLDDYRRKQNHSMGLSFRES